MNIMTKMRKMRPTLLMLALSMGANIAMSLFATAQTEAPQTQTPAPPAPAFGQNAPILSPENPPVTSLDEPSLDLHTATRSFISPAIQVSESADTNGGNQIGTSSLESITRVLGAVDLQQFWSKSDLLLEYLGGGAFYGSPYDVKQLHAAGLEAINRWRTGQVTLRDSFSYLPDGSFAISEFGGAPGLGLAINNGIGNALPGFIAGSQLGSISDVSRLSNTATLDVIQALNPVSAITLVGGYSNAHFYDTTECAIPGNVCLINSDQYTAEGGYTHLLSRHDQIGFVYGFQLFQFPQETGGEVYNHIINIRWGHTISGRLSFIGGIGPQYSDLQDFGKAYTNWSISGRAQLRYKFQHASLIATYEKFTSSGSGFFAGANTQAVRIGFKRPFWRTWDFYGDLSFSYNKKLQEAAFGVTNADSYYEGSVGAIVRKHLGRQYDIFGAYRFNEVGFNTPGGVPVNFVGSTGRIAQRNVGTIGIEWHPTPTRIE